MDGRRWADSSIAATVSANSERWLAARSLCFPFKNATERGLEPVVQIALELPPGRPQPSAAVEMRDSRRVPGCFWTRLIGLPARPGSVKSDGSFFGVLIVAPSS